MDNYKEIETVMLFLFRYTEYQKYSLKLSQEWSLFLASIYKVFRKNRFLKRLKKFQKLRLRKLASQIKPAIWTMAKPKRNAKKSQVMKSRKGQNSTRFSSRKTSKMRRNRLIPEDQKNQRSLFSDSTSKIWIRSKLSILRLATKRWYHWSLRSGHSYHKKRRHLMKKAISKT